MNKSLSLFMITSIAAFHASMDGWSKNHVSPFEPTAGETAAPLDDRHGLFEIDYLYWKPYQEDLGYAVRARNDAGAVTYRVKKPDFDWSSGVRLGLGGYTPDEWDVSLRGTYYYTDGDSSTATTAPLAADAIYPSFLASGVGTNGTKCSNFWRLNFGLLDLTIGRETALSKKFSIHPFIGARAVWIAQKLKGTFVGTDTTGAIPLTAQYRYKNSVWGMGPRAGISSSFYFARDWAFLGGLSGSFVLGNFRAKEKSNRVGTNLPITDLNLKDSDSLIRTNLDGSLGIGWDQWFNQNKTRVYVALLCETSYWFGINQLMNLAVTTQNNGTAITSTVADKRHGDLALFGATLHLQVDF